MSVREALAFYFEKGRNLQVVGQGSDGHEVLQACERLKPGLLLLDLQLPGLSGVAVARALAKRVPETRILAYSSDCDPQALRTALEAGVRGIVEKASPITTLMEGVTLVAAGQAYFCPQVTQVLQRMLTEPQAASPLDQLTMREREVLELVARGNSNKEISCKLGISVKTAENHRHHLMQKLKAHNSADLTRTAYNLGVIRE